MPTTATIISDEPQANGRRLVTYEFTTDNGRKWRKRPKIAAGVDAQADANSRITREDKAQRRAEMRGLINRCVKGEDPATIELDLVARPKLWETLTRRLHNGPRNDLDLDTMKGLAQWVVDRGTPAISADLPGRTNAEINNVLKPQWQALIDADTITEYDPVAEEE